MQRAQFPDMIIKKGDCINVYINWMCHQVPNYGEVPQPIKGLKQGGLQALILPRTELQLIHLHNYLRPGYLVAKHVRGLPLKEMTGQTCLALRKQQKLIMV